MTASRPVLIASFTLMGLRAAADELGVDPLPLLAKFDIDARLIDKTEGFISLNAFVSFLEAAALEFECPHFALLIAKHRPKLGFGVLGQLLKASPDVGTALRKAHRHVAIVTENTRWDVLVEFGQASIVRYERHPLEQPQQQMLSLSIAQYYQLLKGLMGGQWRATSVSFSFPAPPDKQEYKRFFQAPVYFGEEHNAISFPESHLKYAIPTSDPELLEILKKHIETLEQDVGDNISDKVTLLIRQLLDSGSCSLESIAARLYMHPKTLQRALRQDGTTFKELLRKTRLEVAEFYLLRSQIGLVQLADILGYNAPSALTRSFKQEHGMSPQLWRQQNK
jgi:AraC-like DNA-binding protein